jgi:hypothetical protein
MHKTPNDGGCAGVYIYGVVCVTEMVWPKFAFSIDGDMQPLHGGAVPYREDYPFMILTHGLVSVYSDTYLKYLQIANADRMRVAYTIGMPDERDDMVFWNMACERIEYYLGYRYFFCFSGSELTFIHRNN